MLKSAFLATFLAGAALLPAAAAQGPIYPGAAAAARPAGVTLKAPPAKVKTYATSDAFTKVKAWYQAHLKGSMELQQPGMQKTEDAFLVGNGPSGYVVMVRSYQGRTWIIIGPPM